jgi:hypothetical protein
MPRNKYAKIKDEFIQNKQAALGRRVSRFESNLYDRIFDDFLKNLDLSQGSIKASNSNISLTNSLEKIFSQTQAEYQSLFETFGNDLIEVGKLNAKYFEQVDARAADLSGSVAKNANKIIGVDSTGALVEDGFLSRFAKDTTVFQDIKDTVFSSVSSGQSFSDLNTSLKVLVKGNEELQGGFQKHFRTYAYDTYQQVDRTHQELYSTALELTAFLYEGGIMEDSRAFCKYCNGKVFLKDEFRKLTRNQVAKFIKQPGLKGAAAGIPTTGWNPLIDLGGFGCKHSKNYISDILAVELRSDLQIKSGKLIIQK